MTCLQSDLNERLNNCLCGFLDDHPTASKTDVLNGIQDTISDAPVIIAAHRSKGKDND
jgi:hypothetical protein